MHLVVQDSGCACIYSPSIRDMYLCGSINHNRSRIHCMEGERQSVN
jgi:hypothetical protein